MKRLKKQDEKRFWDVREVIIARGYTEEDSDLFLSILPDRSLIYKTSDSANI
jgi:hypothetical protein